jgi:aarF domain-containing kinase
VHRATLRHPRASEDGTDAPAVVAVKVRHPNVASIISRDFAVLRVLAELAGMLPGLSWMRLDESVRQFREPLFEQVDLTREASNLKLFNANFASWRQVSFPRPIEHLVQPAVLVETFEEGSSISTFLQTDDSGQVLSRRRRVCAAGCASCARLTPCAMCASCAQTRRCIADLGCKALLKMMLSDNFVHADLHPGNILVRMDAPATGGFLRLFRSRKPSPHIVLLDCGMTASLSDRNKHNLFKFFAVRCSSSVWLL